MPANKPPYEEQHPARELQERARKLDAAYQIYRTSTSASQMLLDNLHKAIKSYGDAVCDSKLGEIDDDVVQEALIGIAKKLDTFKPEAKFSTWAYRIIFRRCQDKLRGMEREIKQIECVSLEDVPESTIEDEASIQIKRDGNSKIIDTALQKLDGDKQEVIRLRLAGLSYSEIATKLDIKESTARERWRSALEEIRSAAS